MYIRLIILFTIKLNDSMDGFRKNYIQKQQKKIHFSILGVPEIKNEYSLQIANLRYRKD